MSELEGKHPPIACCGVELAKNGAFANDLLPGQERAFLHNRASIPSIVHTWAWRDCGNTESVLKAAVSVTRTATNRRPALRRHTSNEEEAGRQERRQTHIHAHTCLETIKLTNRMVLIRKGTAAEAPCSAAPALLASLRCDAAASSAKTHKAPPCRPQSASEVGIEALINNTGSIHASGAG